MRAFLTQQVFLEIHAQCTSRVVFKRILPAKSKLWKKKRIDFHGVSKMNTMKTCLASSRIFPPTF